jgi:hypothetical protein
MNSWLKFFFSGDNNTVDVKAVSATFCLAVAVVVYVGYVVKDLFVHQVDIPPNIHNITWVFVGAGLLGGAATLLNSKVQGQTPPSPPQVMPHPSDLPPGDGPAG